MSREAGGAWLRGVAEDGEQTDYYWCKKVVTAALCRMERIAARWRCARLAFLAPALAWQMQLTIRGESKLRSKSTNVSTYCGLAGAKIRDACGKSPFCVEERKW